jgi:hypothetical protein
MIYLVLILVPSLLGYLFWVFCSSNHQRKDGGKPGKAWIVVERLSIAIAFPCAFILYRYLLARQQMFFGLEWLRLLLYCCTAIAALRYCGLAVAAMRLRLEALHSQVDESKGKYFVAAIIAVPGWAVSNLLYAWVCNLVFLAHGVPASRTVQVTKIVQDFGKGARQSDTLTGQMESRRKPVKIEAFRFDGPAPQTDLMAADDHHFCQLHVAQPGDTLLAVGHVTTFGFVSNPPRRD